MGLLKTALFFWKIFMSVTLPELECLVESSLGCPYNINLEAEYFCLHLGSEEDEDAGKKLRRIE
jgi:hypothetical protein